MWDKIKRIFHFIMTILLYSLFVILIIVAIMVGLYFVDHYKSVKSGVNRAPLFGAYVIISPSMVPNINVLDAVVTMRVDADKLKKNDVITFISKDPRHSGITVTHRIVGVKKTESGGYAYRTKGDNNNVEDQTLVSYDNVIGKVMLRIPYIGYLQQLLTTQFGWLFVIVLPCLFILSGDIVRLFKVIFMKKDLEQKEISKRVQKQDPSVFEDDEIQYLVKKQNRKIDESGPRKTSSSIVDSVREEDDLEDVVKWRDWIKEDSTDKKESHTRRSNQQYRTFNDNEEDCIIPDDEFKF